MSFVAVKITKNFRSAEVAKQMPFATARTLTQTAKDAQEEVLHTLPQTFTLRGVWIKPRNKFGIKIRPAKKRDLQAEIGTNADWLELHEEGGTKRPRGQHIAIPTENVRRLKSGKISKRNRPRNVKRSFVLQTKNGRVLFQRKFKGKRSHIVALYNLEKRAWIRKRSTVVDPAKRTIRARLHINFEKFMTEALRTVR